MRGVRVVKGKPAEGRKAATGDSITYKLRNMTKKDREALGLPEPLYRHTLKAVEEEYRTDGKPRKNADKGE